MDATELQNTLDSLIATWENEVVEFKQAGNDSVISNRQVIGQVIGGHNTYF